QSRDFVYVGDVVGHLLAAYDQTSRQAPVFNVCTGRATTVADLAGTLMNLADRTPAVQHGPARPGDIRRSVGDPSAAITSLGLAAQVSLADGLYRTLMA
ncbi:MAG TPA: epimerase, partial [Azospirillaceae bacterium]|nr:epimerase [Azospirillaceae bacterium]